MIFDMTKRTSSGGGGSSEEILASGTFTLSSDITGNLVIPVSITGNFSKITKVVVVKDSTTSGVGQTLAWFRLYDVPSELTATISYITELKYCNSSGTASYGARSAITASSIYVDSQTEPTKVTCVRYSNNYHIKADDYHWYIYGIR